MSERNPIENVAGGMVEFVEFIGFKIILPLALIFIPLFFLNEFMRQVWSYSMPEWMADKAAWVFSIAATVAVLFGFLSDGSLRPGSASRNALSVIKIALKWTFPFLLWPGAAIIVSLTPAMMVAPQGMEEEWLRAVAPVGVTLGSWFWHRFSRLQEVSRDVGAFVSPAIQIASLFFAAQTNNIIVIGTSMVSASFAWYLIPVILQLTPHRSNLFYWLAFAFLTSGTICLLVG